MVAHCVRDAGAVGSNPANPTNIREVAVNLIRVRTHCSVPGHGTRCVVAQECRDNGRHYRSMEERLALEFELAADAPDDDGEASR